MLRHNLALAGALLALSGPALAGSASEEAPVTQDRVHAIASRMSRGESYDQAAIRSLPTAPTTTRAQVIAAAMAAGQSHDRAAQAASTDDPTRSESLELVDARWTRHIGAMQAGGAHEAGWAASGR